MTDMEVQIPFRDPVNPAVLPDVTSNLRELSLTLDMFSELIRASPPELRNYSVLGVVSLNDVQNFLQRGQDVISILQSPAGHQLVLAVGNDVETFHVLANISAGLICTSLFVRVATTLLKLNDQSLGRNKEEIEESIEYIEYKIPAIHDKIQTIECILRDLVNQNDSLAFKQGMKIFRVTVNEVEVDINDCHSKLQTTVQTIATEKGKLEERLQELRSSAKLCAVITVISCYSGYRYPSHLKSSIGIGIVSSLAVLSSRYCEHRIQNLIQEFSLFQHTHRRLNEGMTRLQGKLESHVVTAGVLQQLHGAGQPPDSGIEA